MQARALETEVRAPRRRRRGPVLSQLRAERRREHAARELAMRLRLPDAALARALLERGIGPETAAAFELLPLVEVAWADGAIAAPERCRVQAVASRLGLGLGRAARAQLEAWLRGRPDPGLLAAWAAVVARRRSLPGAVERGRRILAGAREVASTSGGPQHRGVVSRSEREALDWVRTALGEA